MIHSKIITILRLSTYFLIFQMICATQAISGDFLPPETPEDVPGNNTLSEPPVKTISLGDFIIPLEKITLKEIQDTIGSGVIHHRGDAGGSLDFLCYSSKSAGRIWIASGELGGNEHIVSTIYANDDTELGNSSDCPELPAQFQPMSINESTWIGSSVDQLEKHFGPPSAEKEFWLFYSYLGKILVNRLDMDRLAVLSVRIKNGKIVTLSVSQVTTH
ncbi:MAG: hypothetical protein LBU06_00760 [Desulfovibrio sp.]|jgi:hypothetical protein|nr:hypothetical protein [Desulfovibrio sp.]